MSPDIDLFKITIIKIKIIIKVTFKNYHILLSFRNIELPIYMQAKIFLSKQAYDVSEIDTNDLNF